MELKHYFPFWDVLTDEQKGQLAEAVSTRMYQKGEVIYQSGLDCIGLLLVLKGQVRVYTLSEEGKELTLYRLIESDTCLFSASCILPGIQFDILAEAQMDTQLLIVDAKVYRQLMEASASVANYTNALMASHFSEVMWLMDQILNKKMGSRLAALLLEESTLTESSVLKITHEQLAAHLGTMREVVTRLLKYFQTEGWVKLSRGTVNLLDIKGLEEMAQESRRV